MGIIHDSCRGAALLFGIAAVLHAVTALDGARVLARAPANAELDVVVALRGPYENWWGRGATMELYLQHRTEPNLFYKLAAKEGQGDGDCSASVLRIAATDVAILCRPEKGSKHTILKFVFDPRAKALAATLEYDVVPFHRIVRTSSGAAFKGIDAVAVRYTDGAFQILREPSKEIEPVKPTLLPKPLPQSTYDQFAKARPRRVKDGYPRDHTNIDEHIGASQKHGSVLWFGKSFYDGEGTTGVGAFGYYDGEYHLYSPPEIANWSVSAILVEDDAVWLGLASCGEWATNAGGLLRFDRKTNKTELIKLPDVIGDIERVGDRLLLATETGLAVVENGRVRRFFVDPLTDGRRRVAEAVLGQ